MQDRQASVAEVQDVSLTHGARERRSDRTPSRRIEAGPRRAIDEQSGHRVAGLLALACDARPHIVSTQQRVDVPDLGRIERVAGALLELVQAARVIHVTVGGKRQERLVRLASNPRQHGGERGEPVPGVDHDVEARPLDEPEVRPNQRIHGRLVQPRDPRIRGLHGKPIGTGTHGSPFAAPQGGRRSSRLRSLHRLCRRRPCARIRVDR